MYYSIIVSECCENKSEESIIYGIEYNDNESHVIVDDITVDYARLNKLVSLCNELDLDVSQINDVVEDFLSE